MSVDAYQDFLRHKVAVAPKLGIEIDPTELNPGLRPHCKVLVPWMLAGGRRALFTAFGLHKTVMQLEAVRIAAKHSNGRGMIVCPLGVRQEFIRDAQIRLHWPAPPKFIRRIEEAGDTGVYLTNYETVRDGKLDPRLFQAASLDEASVLRGFGGTKTFREFMALFAGDDRRDKSQRKLSDGIRFRFVATATPSPNDYIELLAYAAFLGIMDVPAAKTRFFKRNSEKADALTLHPHKEAEFWSWVSTWAVFLQKPSDLGPEFSDDGYVLPPLDVRWHEIPSPTDPGAEKDGQGKMFADAASSLSDAAREKRESLSQRLTKLEELRAEDPLAHRILWHDLEAERHALESAIPSAVSVYGSQDLDEREKVVRGFSDGEIQELAAKPVMLGSGTNLQHHCAWEIFLGIGHKFNDLIQAIHRVQRFGQTRPVRVDFIYTEAERDIRRNVERKWKQHEEMVARMTKIIRDYGLTHRAEIEQLTRSLGVKRTEASGKLYRCINNDCVLETRAMPADSVDLIVTSIPFGTQYEYSPSYNDFGHTDNAAHFWQQMDFLLPELLRILRPGRVAAIHVKDRIQPGGINGIGFQTIEPFSDQTATAFRKHGFAQLARKTIVTDVVRENNQTYRLGWSEQCKDGTRMGAGLPEYLMVFRKPPTDSSNGYADLPVRKNKGEYTRPRWQFDAHGFMRSSGNRPLRPEELEGLDQAAVFQLFKKHSLANVYDFRHDVKIAEFVDKSGWLPSTFMLLQPASWHPDVWTDVVRMRSLNTMQGSAGREQHLCPLPFDIVDRCIEQYSMEGETVLDPFGGLMTVPYCAIKAKRRGIGIELAPRYFLDGAAYCADAEREASMPTLFDILDAPQERAEVAA